MSSFVVSEKEHNQFVSQCYIKRGFSQKEASQVAYISNRATFYGNQTHNALKALHLDDLFGSKVGGCTPNVQVERKEHRFKATEIWNANKKLGQAVALDALERCTQLADEFGTGTISVDNAFHYLYGGAYVIEFAKRGYIVYTNCTSTLAEVVPFGGKIPTLGTNPHSWGFPTTDILGFPICIDWATSAIAMGRVQQLAREGKELPDGCAVDKDGNMTCDPNEVVSLLSFGTHKGYGLSLINELFGAYGGGYLPTSRGHFPSEVKNSCNFFFQLIHPEALAGSFFGKVSQSDNIKAILDDILQKGNEKSLLPGQVEFWASQKSEKAGGLIFTKVEKEAFDKLAEDNSLSKLEFKEC